jgi:hypothetical protein
MSDEKSEQQESKDEGIARGGPNTPPPPGGGLEKGDSEPDPEHGAAGESDEAG